MGALEFGLQGFSFVHRGFFLEPTFPPRPGHAGDDVQDRWLSHCVRTGLYRTPVDESVSADQ
jgi:hypothetical protein